MCSVLFPVRCLDKLAGDSSSERSARQWSDTAVVLVVDAKRISLLRDLDDRQRSRFGSFVIC